MFFLTGFFHIIFYSFIGWIAEVSYWFIQEGYFINRGFLTAPLCPMYGIGIFAGVKVINRYSDNIKSIFIVGVIVSAIMEQTTSYILEQLFNLKLWDYSYSKWNINGRLSAKNLILFGLFSILLIKVINPVATKISDRISKKNLSVFAVIMAIYLSVDIAITVIAMNKINSSDQLDTDKSTNILELVPARREVIKELITKGVSQ